MRIVYLGTPLSAVPPLRALVDAGHDVAMAVTRPDRRRGRGSATGPSPLKVEALRLAIPVVDDLAQLSGLHGVELGVVVAYGRIVPARLLDVVPMVNLHFSLLPRWRGAAPVERAILAGDEVTGVSVMALEATLDTGPLYATRSVAIEPDETLVHLRDRLSEVGARLLVETLGRPLGEPTAQEGPPTYAEKLEPQEQQIAWERSAEEIARVVRLGRAWSTWRGRRLLILRAAVVAAPDGAAGTLVGDVVATGSGGLRLLSVQPEGRVPMTTATWQRGVRARTGERFSTS